MAWSAIVCWAAAVGCFLRGAFELSWDGLPWMFGACVSFVAAVVFTLCAALA